jgi:hypothetical protein
MEQKDNWIQSYWRPVMAYAYTAIIVFDFIVAPILWSILQVYFGTPDVQWKPLTLDTGGVFHAAMGAIVGVSAFTRGQEKVERVRNQTAPLSSQEAEQQIPPKNFGN